MPRLTEGEQQEIIRYIESDKHLPEKYRFLLFEDKREVELVWNGKSNEVSNIPNRARPTKIAGMEQPEQLEMPEYEGIWTGDFIFENEWQSFRTKKDRSLELQSVFHECEPGRRKLAVQVVDIFGNDTMTIVEVMI